MWYFKLQREFEVDKQQAVQRAMGNQQKELDRIRQKTEEACRTQYMEEMKKLAQKHKTEISATKKKQWVSGIPFNYNRSYWPVQEKL